MTLREAGILAGIAVLSTFGFVWLHQHKNSCKRLADICEQAQRELNLEIISICHVAAVMRTNAGDHSPEMCYRQLDALKRATGR